MRCEACGALVESEEATRKKVVGKVRELCQDCSAKLQKVDQGVMTTTAT